MQFEECSDGTKCTIDEFVEHMEKHLYLVDDKEFKELCARDVPGWDDNEGDEIDPDMELKKVIKFMNY